MRPLSTIAPRVVVYPHGTPRPPVAAGWLALAQFDSWPPAALDSPPPAQTVSGPDAKRSTSPPLEPLQPAVARQPERAGPAPEPLQPAATLRPERPGPAPEPLQPAVALQPAGVGLQSRSSALGVPPRRRAVFGDGSHPTTRLCAVAVDLLCRQRPGLAVLDVGTGTGILARIARARGASFVVGTDIDPSAIACAQAHAELDESGSPGGTATGLACAGGAAGTGVRDPVIGSRPAIDTIHFGGEAPDHWGAWFDLVVANILEAPLHGLASALCRALKPGGVLLISGFTRPQAPALRLAYETAGLKSAAEFTLEGWVLLKFTAAVPDGLP